MEWVIEAPVRFYVSIAMMAVGGWIVVRGLRSEVRSIRMPAADPAKSMALMQSFRVCIIGLALLTLGIAWMTEQLWLALIAAAIGGEELFESSMAIGAMRAGGPGVRPRRYGEQTAKGKGQAAAKRLSSMPAREVEPLRPLSQHRGGAVSAATVPEATRVLCYVVPATRK